MITFKGVANIGLQNLESGAFISGLVRKRHSYSTNCINDLFESAKVNVDVVVDRDAKVLFDCAYQTIRVLLVEIGVDASTTS